MSGKWKVNSCILAVHCLCLGMPGQIQAAGFPDMWDDPLNARPPVLDNAQALPGDSLAGSCPPAVDLSQPLSLGDAIDLALCNNPQIKSAWASIKVQSAALGEARAAYLPTLNSTLSRLNTATHYPEFSSADTNNWGNTAYAGLNWRLFDFGGRESNKKAANALLAAAMAQHDATLQKTLTTVVGAYFDALSAQAAFNARSQAATLAEQTGLATQRREARGTAARNDTLQAQTALAKSQLAAQRAQGDHRKTLSILAYALGVAQQPRLVLPEQSSMPAVQAIEDLSAWLESTQQQHPAIIAARAQWQAAQAKITSARSEGLPTLDFVSNFYQNGYPNQGLQLTRTDTTTYGVTLTIPIFEGFARTYKIRGAQAQAEQSEAQLQDVEHQILGEVVKAHADAQSSLANLASSENLLSSAQEALISSQNRYERGASDILELLSVQSALADAQQERIRCLSEWQSARLRLWAAAGLMGRNKIAGSEEARLPQASAPIVPADGNELR